MNARKCKEYEITVEMLLNLVHTYTTRIIISVVMGDAWRSFPETKRMHDFKLTNDRFGYISKARTAKDHEESEKERDRLLKYYGDCPVWNLTTSLSYDWQNSTYVPAIEVHCHYRDIRDGWLAERAEIKREKQREYYRKRRKAGKANES